MANKEYRIDIVVNDQGAVETLKSVDAAGAGIVSSANQAGESVVSLEGKLALAKAEAANASKEMKLLTAAMADMSAQARGQLQGELTTTAQKVADTQQNVSKLSAELKAAKGPIDDVAASAKTGSTAFDQMGSMATRIVERLAILYALRGTLTFVEDIVQSAHQTEMLATTLDMTTTRVQELQYAAGQSDVPFTTMTNAADHLQRSLAKGGDGVVGALDNLGLSLTQLRAMKGEQAFDTVTTAVAALQDRTKRTGDEVALFGTDKIDPVVGKLHDLEQEAHAVNVVLSDEQVKALSDVAKWWDTVTAKAKAYAAVALAIPIQGAQEGGVGGFLGSVVPFLPPALQGLLGSGGTTPSLDDHIGHQLPGMQGSTVPPPLPTMGGLTTSGSALSDPATQKNAMAALDAEAKTLDATTRQLIADETQFQQVAKAGYEGQIAQLHQIDQASKSAYGPAERIAMLSQLDDAETILTNDILRSITVEKERIQIVDESGKRHIAILQQIAAEEAKLTKATNDQVVAELNAKEQLNAMNGLDIHGAPLGLRGDPLTQAQKATDAIKAKAVPGIDQTNQLELVNQQFLKSEMDRAKADDAAATASTTLATAHDGAATAAGTLSRSHAGASAAAGLMAGNFVLASNAVAVSSATMQGAIDAMAHGASGFLGGGSAAITSGGAGGFLSNGPISTAGMFMPHFATGGPITQDGPIFAHAGEMVVPKDGMLVKGGSGGDSGAVYISIDAKGATFEDDRSLDRLADKVQQRIGKRFGGLKG